MLRRPPAAKLRRWLTTDISNGCVLTSKISRVSGTPARPVEHPFAYDDTFTRELVAGGKERLRVGLRTRHTAMVRSLGAVLAPPFRLLYVLHTSRVDAPLGSYESPDLAEQEVAALLERFSDFLDGDARHDIWLHSMPDEATVVLDRYNMIWAYGPLDQYENVLRARGIQEVAAWARPAVPSPHALHYHEEWDDAERTLLAALDWHRKPLRPADVRIWSGPQAS